MKAVNINMSEAKTSKTIKAVIAGVIVGAVLILLVTVILTLFLNLSGNLFENLAGYIMLLPLMVGGYTGGFTSARINGANGLLLGGLTSIIMFIIMLIIGFAGFNTDITYMILLKAICLILPAVIGGIKGVNKKEKFRI